MLQDGEGLDQEETGSQIAMRGLAPSLFLVQEETGSQIAMRGLRKESDILKFVFNWRTTHNLQKIIIYEECEILYGRFRMESRERKQIAASSSEKA